MVKSLRWKCEMRNYTTTLVMFCEELPGNSTQQQTINKTCSAELTSNDDQRVMEAGNGK